jgi:putative transcription factor
MTVFNVLARGFVSLYCEVCGREIVGRPGRALVEGATMVVCNQCAGLGTALPGFPDRPRPRALATPRSTAPAPRLPLQRLSREVEESELLEEIPKIVKQAREKLGISQQDLAIKAKEKLTMIQKIETGKISPTMRLAIELEHILHVRLMAPRKEVEIPNPPIRQTGDTGATLGDVALVRHKENSRGG